MKAMGSLEKSGGAPKARGKQSDQTVPRARATYGLRRMRGSRQTVLLARRAPTIKQWSLDARSEEQSAYSPFAKKLKETRKTYPSLDARSEGQSGHPA